MVFSESEGNSAVCTPTPQETVRTGPAGLPTHAHAASLLRSLPCRAECQAWSGHRVLWRRWPWRRGAAAEGRLGEAPSRPIARDGGVPPPATAPRLLMLGQRTGPPPAGGQTNGAGPRCRERSDAPTLRWTDGPQTPCSVGEARHRGRALKASVYDTAGVGKATRRQIGGCRGLGVWALLRGDENVLE